MVIANSDSPATASQGDAKLVVQEDELIFSSANLMQVVEALPSCVLMVDQRGIITMVNKQTEKLFGHRRNELLGKPFELLMPERFRSIHGQNFFSYLEHPTSRFMGQGRDLRGLHKSGLEFSVEIGLNTVDMEDGSYVLAFIIDITQRKLAEEVLRKKNEELKSFAYTVSHDLKAPLRGISGYAQELERRFKDALPERAQFCITQILTATENLDRLIEDLLKYSRIESDQPAYNKVILADMLNGILSDRSHVLDELKVEVSMTVAPVTLSTWKRGLHQVLSNLIDNAIKYSRNSQPPRLGIDVEAINNICRVTVTDNGIGFDMQYHDRIFGLFNRLVRAKEFEGTGAGLAIVKKVMEKLGGSIRAESILGQGSSFIIELAMSSAIENQNE